MIMISEWNEIVKSWREKKWRRKKWSENDDKDNDGESDFVFTSESDK